MTTQPTAALQFVRELPTILKMGGGGFVSWLVLRRQGDHSTSWLDRFPEFAKAGFQLLRNKNANGVFGLGLLWAGFHYARSAVFEVKIMAVFPFFLGVYAIYLFLTSKS